MGKKQADFSFGSWEVTEPTMVGLLGMVEIIQDKALLDQLAKLGDMIDKTKEKDLKNLVPIIGKVLLPLISGAGPKIVTRFVQICLENEAGAAPPEELIVRMKVRDFNLFLDRFQDGGCLDELLLLAKNFRSLLQRPEKAEEPTGE